MPFENLTKLVRQLDITKFAKSPTAYMPEELERLNHKLQLIKQKIVYQLMELGK